MRVCGGGNSTAPIFRTDRVFASYRPPEPVTRGNASVGFPPARAPLLIHISAVAHCDEPGGADLGGLADTAADEYPEYNS